MHLIQLKPAKLFLSFFLFCLIVAACTATSFGNDAGGPLLRMSFSGTSNDPAWVFKLDTSAGYRFNRNFEISGGIPIYFVRASDSGATEGFSSKNGIGDAYINLKLMISKPAYYFSSSIKGAAPTGDEGGGFSTGRATFDWTNYLEGDIGKWTPFGSAGIANTISDTHFFNRPFTTLGLVGHFEGGLYFWPSEKIGIAGSAYAVTPTGQQKIYSRLVQRQSSITPPSMPDNSGRGNRRRGAFEDSSFTLSEADAARDHGASAWIDIYPISNVTFEIGFSRSMSYEYNSIFFSLHLDFGKLLSKRRR